MGHTVLGLWGQSHYLACARIVLYQVQEAKKGRKQCKNQIVNKSQVEEDEMCIDVGNRENNFVLVSII